VTGNTIEFIETQSSCYDSMWFSDIGTYSWTKAWILSYTFTAQKYYYPDGTVKDSDNNLIAAETPHSLNIPDINVVE